MRMIRGMSMLLLAAMAVTTPVWASIFSKDKDKLKFKEEPLPQWGVDAAKTPTPAYAKDAAAVVLFDEYLETVDGEGRAVERRRLALRILKPQGRNNYGHPCLVEFNDDEKINSFNAWTIAADGKQYQAKQENFFEEGDTDVPIMLSTDKVFIALPPALDVGAVEVCESEELMAPYSQEEDWSIQQDIPIVSQALEVDLPAGRAHSEAWHKYSAVKPVEVAPNHWRWEIKDMKALDLRDIPSPPEWGALAARMSVEWGDAAVEGTEAEWRALGQDWTNLEAHRPDSSPEITVKTQELITSAPDFYTKISRITDYIQKNVRYFVVMRGIGGWQANPASEIFRNRYGDCKDKTTLLISMLQVAEIHGFYVLVDDRRNVVDPAAPSFHGNHMITAIEIPVGVQDPRLMAVVKAKDGKRYLIFDPTNERTAVGNLPSYEQGSYGLLAAGASSQVIALPVLSPDANDTVQKGEFTIAQDGTLSGSVDTSHSGPGGGDLRLFLKYTDEKERHEYWEKRVANDVPGAVLDSFTFVQPAALDQPLEFHYKLTANAYAHPAGALLLVRPRVVGSDVLPNDDKPRTVPIDLSATGHWHDSYDIRLPEGYLVDDMPDPVNLDTDFASYHSSVSVPAADKGRVLHYERDYKVKQVELPAEKQPEFLHFEGTVMADEMATVVLKRVAVTQATVASGSKQ